jgi:hypothetical protein
MPGPIARIAVVINTFYPEIKGGYYFDHELVSALSNKLIGDNSVELLYKGATLSAFQAVANEWRRNAEIDDPDDPCLNDIYDVITIRRHGKTIRRIFGADFHQFGGPEPYHDSVTLDIYLHPEESLAVKNDLKTVMDELSCKYTEINGEPVPSNSLFVRLRHFFMLG